jgi:cell division septum initiation protein DivIVA
MAEEKFDPYSTVTLGLPSEETVKKEVSAEPQSSVSVTGVPADYLGPAAVGAAAGAAAAKYGPQPYDLHPEFIKDQQALQGKIAAHTKAADLMNEAHAAHMNNMGSIFQAHGDKLNALKHAESILEQATEHANAIGAIRPDGAGANWIPTSAAIGTPTGTAETTVSEAGQLSRMAKDRPPGYGLTNAGIYVPGAGDAPPILTREQEAARAMAVRNYEQALKLQQQHEKAANASAAIIEKLRGTTSPTVNKLLGNMNELDIQKAEIEQRLRSKTPQPNMIDRAIDSIPYGKEAASAMNKVNQFINKTPGLKYAAPALSAGLGVPQAMEGAQHYGEGQKVKGALEMLSGAGGVVGAFPHPMARAAGALAQVPYAGYEAAEALYDRLHRNK